MTTRNDCLHAESAARNGPNVAETELIFPDFVRIKAEMAPHRIALALALALRSVDAALQALQVQCQSGTNVRLVPRRASDTGMVFRDDMWLNSPERQPLSDESLDVLFKYGPIIYRARCFDAEEYDASVCRLMARYPKCSRALAEQEIHEFLSDANGYMAKTTQRDYKGPQETALKSPVALADKLLVLAWVLILVPAAGWLVTLSMAASTNLPSDQLADDFFREEILSRR